MAKNEIIHSGDTISFEENSPGKLERGKSIPIFSDQTVQRSLKSN